MRPEESYACPQCGSIKSWHFFEGDYNAPGDRFDKANPDTGHCWKCGFSYSEHVAYSLESQIKKFREQRKRRPPMSKKEPTKKELIGLLDTWKHTCEKDCQTECSTEFKESECEPCFKAIRSLIEKFFEWQSQSKILLENKSMVESVRFFLKEIHDFGKEGK